MNYTEEQLYGSGILPPAPNTQVVDPFYDYAQSLHPQTAPTPNDTGVPTPTPAPASVAPGVAPSGLAPGEAVKVKEGEGVSVANSGLNFDTLGKLEKRDPVGKNVAKRMAPIDAELQAQSQIQNQNAMNEAQTIQGYTDVGKAQAEIQSKYDVEQSRLVDEHNNNVALAEEKGRQRIQSAMDQHERLKNEYLTMQVDPGMMWKNMTGGEKAGSGLAVFMSAFLGAKGIDTPVMGLLDKALDRNIDAQLQNINQRGRALDAQGEFVQMVRQQSASDLEAKLRLKDAALESAKYAVSAEMSKYGSKLAELKGQELINNLNKDQLKFKQGIFQERTNIENAITGQEIQAQGDRMRAAAEAKRLAFDREKEEARKLEADKVDVASIAAKINARAIVDPTDPTKFLIAPENMNDTAVLKAQEKAAATTSTLKIIRELKEANRSLDSTYDGPLKNLSITEKKAKRDQLQQMLTNEMALRWNGTTYSDKWADTMKTVIPKQTWTFDVDTDSTLGQLESLFTSTAKVDKASYYQPNETELALYRKRVGAPIDDIGPNQAGVTNNNNNTFDAVSNEEGNASNINKKPEQTPASGYVGKIDAISSKHYSNPNSVSDTRTNDYINYSKSNHEYTQDEEGNVISATNPDKQFEAVGDLYDLVRGGDAEALKALQDLAVRTKSPKGKDTIGNTMAISMRKIDKYSPSRPQEAKYANFFLEKLNADKAGVDYVDMFLKDYEPKVIKTHREEVEDVRGRE